MALSTALRGLRDSTAALASAVNELVMIVHEDRPAGSEVAVVDHLAEVVSEVQASVMVATSELAAIVDPVQLPERLAAADRAIAECGLRYWRDLRSHGPLSQLRQTARERGPEWRAWQRSLELSQLRCEQPLIEAAASVRAGWLEVGELVGLWLSRPPPDVPAPTHPADPTGRGSVPSTSTSTGRTP